MQTSSSDLQCDVCGKKPFATKQARDIHRANVHPLVEPFYKCTENGCSECFMYIGQLWSHIKEIHCGNYICCGYNFATKQAWTKHRLSQHINYDDKINHLSSKLDGENYLPKIYFVVEEHGALFKVGSTQHPMSNRLSDINIQYGVHMKLQKCLIMSKKFEEQNLLELAENALIQRLIDLGFQQHKVEWFHFKHRELDQKFIEDCMETVIKAYEEKVSMVSIATSQINHVERSRKRECTRTTNPTNKQLKQREKQQNWYKKSKGRWIYCARSVAVRRIVKIGQTTQNPKYRLQTFSSIKSDYGKFEVIQKFPLDERYQTVIQREGLEKQVIYEMGQRFPRIEGKKEHFECLDDAQVIQVIEMVLERNKNIV